MSTGRNIGSRIGSGRLSRLAFGACAAAMLAGTPHQALSAPIEPLPLLGPMAGADAGLTTFLLPYSPYIFDFFVTFARSAVTLTYDARGFDPVTGDFYVSGLKLGRGGVDVAIDRIRIDAASAIYEGIAIDTREIPMEKDARDALKRLDSEVIRGNVVAAVTADVPSATYDIDIAADFANIGALKIAAKVAGFHLLVPLDSVEAELATPPMDGEMPSPPPPAVSDEPVVAGHLVSATLAYDDAGLTPAGFDLAAAAQNMAPEELRGAMAIMLTPMVASLFDGLPGGASPALQERAAGWSTALQAYLAKPEHLEISFSPEEPFDLSQIRSGQPLTEEMILALDPAVTTAATESTALVDPSTNRVSGIDDLSLAERLVEGLGVPQDVGRGVQLALADVAAGKPDAADIVARGIVLDPAAAVSQDAGASSYTLLLVAKARGTAVPDSVTSAVRARLSAAEITAAETQAMEQWRATDAGSGEADRESALVDARDWGGMRDLAYDLYEGRSVPRNVARAFAFAQVAAAGGDKIASRLRDDLTAALNAGQLPFDAAAGRTEANAMWSTIVGAAVDAQTSPPAATPSDGTSNGNDTP